MVENQSDTPKTAKGNTFSQMRSAALASSMQADKKQKLLTGRDHFGTQQLQFLHHLTSIIIGRALILGPLERFKTIM